jgi:hypothetical protein
MGVDKGVNCTVETYACFDKLRPLAYQRAFNEISKECAGHKFSIVAGEKKMAEVVHSASGT